MQEKRQTKRRIVQTIVALILTVSMIPLPAEASASSDRGDGTFCNPVIYSDVPDMDVIRVGDTYYMSSTTMHMSPGVPIMKSKDLVNWEIVNYVYDTLSDNDAMSLRNGQNAYANGSWASSLRYHDGKYYIAFMSYTTGKTYVYTTDDIENGVWKHVEINGTYHDMGLFFDDDGKIYMAYGGGTIKIVEMEIVENGLQVKPGTEKVFISDVWKGTDLAGKGVLGEGTHLQKINGKYYAFLISWPSANEAAGTTGMRTELCFRADSIQDFIDGNWERKIVLQDKGAAQGGIIDTEDGDWYGLVFRDIGPVGRCPVLVPVTWKDGWPMMGNKDGKVDDVMTSPLPSQGEKSVVISDEFYNGEKRPSYTKEHEANAAKAAAASMDGMIETMDVHEGDEVIVNGGFENGTEGWTAKDSEIASDTTEKLSGTGSVKVTNRKATGSGPQQDISGQLEAGDMLDISYNIKYTTGPDTKRFILTAIAAGKFTNLVGGDAKKGEWTNIKGSFVIPEDMDTSDLKLFFETPWTAEPDAANDLMDYYVDDVVITRRILEQPKAGESDYNGSNLKLEWQWNHNPNNKCWSLTERPGYLRLTTGSISTSLTDAKNTLTQRTYGPQCSGAVAIETANMKNGDVAGLAAFTAKYGYVGVKMAGGKKYLVMVGTKESGDNFAPYEAASVELSQDRVYLKIDFDFENGNKANFYYSLDGKKWNKIGDELDMVYSLVHFMGYRFGLFNYATRSLGGSVDFDYFRVEDELTGTKDTEMAGSVMMENAEGLGVANTEIYVPVKMSSLPEGNYESIEASIGIPEGLSVSDVTFNEKNVTGTATYSYVNGQLLLTVNGKDAGYKTSGEDELFATVKLKVTDYVTQDTAVTVAADYVKTTGDKVVYDVSGAKAEVTLKYVDMKAAAKKPGTSNPLIDHKFGADPYAMEYNGRVYIYMTNDSQEYEKNNNGATDNTYANINTINVISSADMVNWTDHGSIPVAGKNNPEGAAKWAACSWAPAAAHKTIDGKEKFFLYFADGGGGIGVLTADSPIGPFTDPIGKALVAPGSPHSQGVVWLFDPAVLVDDDGTGYLYYGGGVPEGQADNPKTSRVVKLTDDMVHLDGDAQVIDAPAIFEDSGIHKYGDKYYYSYCSNFDGHPDGYPAQGIICYMESDSPMGPFTYKGEILDNPWVFFEVGGNNHHAIFDFNGKYYITYHAQTLGKAIGNTKGYRSTHINEIDVNSDGSINRIMADMKGVSQLKTVEPYERLEGEMFAWQSGIQTAVCEEEGSLTKDLNMAVTGIQSGDWTAIAGVDFGINGAEKLTANVAALSGGTIEIRLDSCDGTKVGTMEVPAGDGSYQKLECTLDSAVGEHNVFFVFKGEEGKELVQVDYWQFAEKEEEPQPQPPVEKLPYVDVAEDDWFYDGVYYNFVEGTMTGKDKEHFAPYENLARAQFAIIVHRLQGTPKVAYEPTFPDVADEVWYTDAILWAAKNKIVTGYTSNGYFGPADNILREQMAVMMYRYANSLDYDTSKKADFSKFEDAALVNEYAKDAMKWAVGNGIIKGKDNETRVDPLGNASRAECAIIIQRFMETYKE